MGPALCLVSAACFGAMAIFGKLAYSAGVSPAALLLVRFGLAAAVLMLLLLLRPSLRRSPSPPVSPPVSPPASPTRPARAGAGAGVLATAVGLGAIGYAAQASLYFSALEVMDASLLSLVFYTYPLLVTVTAVLLGRDRLTSGRVAALVAASCGTLLVLLGTGGLDFDPLGALLAFGASITYTVYILVSDTVVHRLPPVLLSTLVMTGAACTLAARALLTGGVDLGFGLRGWLWLACIAVVSTVVAMLTFFAGLRRTGPSTAAILSTFEPVVTTALAALTLAEFLTPVQLAGGLLVLSSVAVLQARPARAGRRARQPRQTPERPAVDAPKEPVRETSAAGGRRSRCDGP
ncbi:DMT family transporter [Planomonospora sp. ID67723]|uniref:DMT family transporter n=1 Tax=Planomonospora sp. ID67723 TaxID=2738134 RepID=UPI0018C4232B|nr:DMT family transporter [Planomonospora sp. ID67723]MBG0827081.1 DMT family transporter [Planomonospora sp. ID67723]